MRFQLRRLPILLLVAIIVAGVLQVDAVFLFANTQSESAFSPLSGASSRVMHVAKKRKKSRKSKKQRKSRSRRSSRRYTLRGNPEVTRRVASNLIVETLPELAQLVGLEAIPSPSSMNGESSTQSLPNADQAVALVSKSLNPTAGDATAGSTIVKTSGTKGSIPTTGVTAAAPAAIDYTDSELSLEEDPDKLTVEDDELLAEDDELTIDEFYDEFTDYMAALNPDADIYVTDNGIDKIVAMESLMEWLGTRYLFGGTSRSGIDCSAFTRTIYGSIGCPLPRTAAMQWDVGEEISYEELQFGDLVFFHTRSGVYVSHVGMYLGNNMFAHASSRNGVTVSSLGSAYYSTHFIGARRYDVAAAKAQAALESESMSEAAATDTEEIEAPEVIATHPQESAQ